MGGSCWWLVVMSFRGETTRVSGFRFAEKAFACEQAPTGGVVSSFGRCASLRSTAPYGGGGWEVAPARVPGLGAANARAWWRDGQSLIFSGSARRSWMRKMTRTSSPAIRRSVGPRMMTAMPAQTMASLVFQRLVAAAMMLPPQTTKISVPIQKTIWTSVGVANLRKARKSPKASGPGSGEGGVGLLSGMLMEVFSGWFICVAPVDCFLVRLQAGAYGWCFQGVNVWVGGIFQVFGSGARPGA